MLVPGSPQSIRNAASQAQHFGALARAALADLKTAESRIADAGDEPAMSKLRTVLAARAASLADLDVKAGKVAAALSKLATDIEAVERQAQHAKSAAEAAAPGGVPGMTLPVYNPTVFHSAAATARSGAASVIGSALPTGGTVPLVNPDEGQVNVWEDFWNYGIYYPVKDTWDSIVGIPQLPALGGLLYDAVVNDRFPNGETGARQVVLDALKELPAEFMNKELLDRDPGAWVAVTLLHLIPLILSRGGSLAVRLASKLGIKAISLPTLIAAKGADAASDALFDHSATSRLFASSSLRDSLLISTLATKAWPKSPLGIDGRGRDVELAVQDILSSEHPNLIDLPWPHRRIDFADYDSRSIFSVKSIDPSLPTYANNPNAMRNVLNGYADDLRDWDIAIKPGPGADTRIIPVSENWGRHLDIGIPSDGISPEQMRVLEDWVQTYRTSSLENGDTPVTIRFVEVPR